MKLKDNVAIVTGGGSGIGRAIALGFAREGSDVVVAARGIDRLKKVAQEIEGLGRKALALKIASEQLFSQTDTAQHLYDMMLLD